jgi:hypothetical protein
MEQSRIDVGGRQKYRAGIGPLSVTPVWPFIYLSIENARKE